MARTVEQIKNIRIWDTAGATLALSVLLAVLLWWPGDFLDKADHAAYAVCHRIPGHSFIIAGRPMPLCARCSGTYLGALAGFIVLIARGRGRAVGFPARRFVAILAAFLVAWALDGLNSYLSLFPGLPYLYEPQNTLRLATGALEGLAISAFLLPVLNLTLWAKPSTEASIVNWGDMLWLLAGATVVVSLVSSGWVPLLYPLALISGLMVVLLVGSVNSSLLIVALHRDGRAAHWREVAAPLLAGLTIGVIELTAIGVVRAFLTDRFGLPFS